MLVEGAVFITLWIYADTKIELWVYGLLWSIGFLGVWGPATTYTTEMYPTRIRGIANGFSWAVPFLLGDRKRGVAGKSVSVRVKLGGRRILTKKNPSHHNTKPL